MTRIVIYLTPNASHNKIESWSCDEKEEKALRVNVKPIPDKGKANQTLIKLLPKPYVFLSPRFHSFVVQPLEKRG